MPEISDDILKVVKALQAKFGKMYIGTGSEILDEEYARKSSGNFALDYHSGGGLVVAKKIITIAGDESSGKTATALIAVGEVQKQGGTCAWLDVEHSFDAQWAKKLGVDVSKLFIAQPKSIEEVTDTIEPLLMSAGFDLIVLDSVASAPSDKELEDSAEQKSMGGIAKPVGLMMKKITARLNDVSNPVKTCVILINQIREKVGIAFGNPNYMPCGRALKFHSDIIIWLRPDTQPVGGKEDPKGININYIFKKNRTFPPFKSGTYELLFLQGRINNQQSILEAGVETGVIKKVGYKYTYKDKSASDDKSIIELLSGKGYFTKTNLKECHPKADEIIKIMLENGLAKEVGNRFKLCYTLTTNFPLIEKLTEANLATEAYIANIQKLNEFIAKITRNDWDLLKKEVIEARKANLVKENSSDYDDDIEEVQSTNQVDIEGL
jgi:recombination protein RecA